MKRLRFAAIMAVGLLLAFVLCACGQAPDTADPGETAAVTGESAAGETTAAAEVVSDPVGFVSGNVIKEGVCVEAVFLGIQKQPLTLEDGTVTDVDTIWIYYSDGTFELFATVDNHTVLFSVGTYAFEEGGDFIYMEDGDLGDITINRTEKYVPGQGLAEHESSHTYDLATLGFTQLYAPDAGKNIVTIFTGPEKQPRWQEKSIAGAAAEQWREVRVNADTIIVRPGDLQIVSPAERIAYLNGT